ncbi:hypothetical protein Anas_02395 [Armadillidium nasatum]|uniref:Uncharacterized protein n=1 Tax=Armadillidium nasatum TaxID=96803 RepID=A0A5N5TKE1_9CRUS|nr:hypothetical protein Anas_02395 [Armadillidium nasatum]
MSQSEGDVKTPESAESSIADGKLLTRLSLNSIPSIDRSDDESPSSNSNDQPNLAHTPPPEDIVPHTQPILAHTPPPHDDIRSSQPVPNLAHTPPPPPAPQTAAEALAESSHRSSPRVLDESPGDTYATIPGSSDPSTPDPRRPPFPIGYKRSSLDAGNPEPMGYGVLGSSPPSLNGAYGAIGGLYNSSHPSSGIYSGSASLGSIYGNSGPPPPIPPPPLDAGIIESHHRREHSFNSLHSVNSLREYYDKGLNRCISTSPKLSNRNLITTFFVYNPLMCTVYEPFLFESYNFVRKSELIRAR